MRRWYRYYVIGLILGASVLPASSKSKQDVKASATPIIHSESEAKAKRKQEPKVSMQKQPKKDGWQRMKECAEQAERLAKRRSLVEGAQTGEVTVIGLENHYSPKYGRCYLNVSYQGHSIGEKNRDQPFFYYELYDAFEGKLLVGCTDSPIVETHAFCYYPDSKEPIDCEKCRQFVKDRMNN